MSPQESHQNKQVLVHLMEKVFNQGDYAAAEGLVDPGFVNHESPDSPGPEGFVATARWLRSAFPDLHAELHEVVAEGDLVAGRLTVSGTHRGDCLGVAGTGRSFSVQHLHLYRLVDGRVAEHWACRDDVGHLAQLGLTPPVAVG